MLQDIHPLTVTHLDTESAPAEQDPAEEKIASEVVKSDETKAGTEDCKFAFLRVPKTLPRF